LCAARIAVRRDAPSGEPPVRGAQAWEGVLPGLFVGAAVGVAVGAVVGIGVAVRVAVGAAVAGAAELAATVGVGEIRTVSGVQASAPTEMSVNSAPNREFRVLICSNSL
jgi:hypothetical protein